MDYGNTKKNQHALYNYLGLGIARLCCSWLSFRKKKRPEFPHRRKLINCSHCNNEVYKKYKICVRAIHIYNALGRATTEFDFFFFPLRIIERKHLIQYLLTATCYSIVRIIKSASVLSFCDSGSLKPRSLPTLSFVRDRALMYLFSPL